MNKTEYIGKLNALYVGEKNCLEELITIYDEKDKEIERLNKQIEEYQKALDETTSEKIDLENIIEEDKKIEKIPYQFNLNYIDSKLDSYTKEEINNTINHIYDKINEIIDKLNEGE